MAIANITYFFDPPNYPEAQDDLQRLNDIILGRLQTNFKDFSSADLARQEYIAAKEGFEWGFPVETYEQRMVKHQAFDAAIASNKLAKSWKDFLDQAHEEAGYAFHELSLGDPDQSLRFEVKINTHADSAPREIPVYVRPLESGFYAGQAAKAAGKRVVSPIELFTAAIGVYTDVYNQDKQLEKELNPKETGALRELEKSRQAVVDAWDAVRDASRAVSQEEADAAGLGEIKRKALELREPKVEAKTATPDVWGRGMKV